LRRFQEVQTHSHPTNGSGVMVTESWGGVISGLIELLGQLWTFGPVPYKIRKNLEYQNPREIFNLSNGG
jgi:hypothetical protein